MSEVRALFVGEGTSDARLAPHLRTLLVHHGARVATVDVPDLSALARPPGHAVEDKVRAAVRLFPGADLLLVHRDADAPDPGPRIREIANAAAGRRHVAVVPVYALEAWLLHDAEAILAACGRAPGAVRLALPSRPEALARPKETLTALIDEAQREVPARRRRTFVQVRSQLLEQLDPFDPALARIPSWVRLGDDLTRALAR